MFSSMTSLDLSAFHGSEPACLQSCYCAISQSLSAVPLQHLRSKPFAAVQPELQHLSSTVPSPHTWRLRPAALVRSPSIQTRAHPEHRPAFAYPVLWPGAQTTGFAPAAASSTATKEEHAWILAVDTDVCYHAPSQELK